MKFFYYNPIIDVRTISYKKNKSDQKRTLGNTGGYYDL